MNFNEGYRQTEIGIIPKEWQVKRLANMLKITGGFAFSSNDSQVEGIRWLKIANVGVNKVLWDDESFLPAQFKNDYRNFLLKSGDLVVALTRPILNNRLKIARIRSCDEPCLLNQRVGRIEIKENTYKYFIYYLLQQERIIFALLQSMAGTDPPNLGNEALYAIKAIYPPFSEQKKIAEILSTWDKAIETCEKLLTAKQMCKRALTQRLLTGKQRFSQFANQVWKEVSLGEFFKEIKDINDGGNSHSVMTISARRGLISQKDKFDRVIAGNSLKKYTQLKQNDFAYNKGNSKTYQMGCIYQLEDKESALVPFVYICFRPTNAVYPAFYKHWFLAHGLDRQLKKIITSGARGDGLLNVNKTDFFKLKIPFPPKEEQVSIAQIFDAIDKEIDLLEKQRDLLKQQKRGLMQKLLTGKIRVIINESEKATNG